MTTKHSIKRGISLYSYQEEYFLRKLNLEQCIAQASAIGALGIESLAEQMMPEFPRLSDAFYDQWHGWMAKYRHSSGLTPTFRRPMSEFQPLVPPT